MRKLALLFILFISIVALFSCKDKDTHKLPSIALRYDTFYLRNDTSISLFLNGNLPDTLLAAVTCAKSEADDKLVTLNISRVTDDKLPKTIQSIPLAGSEVDGFVDKPIWIPTSSTIAKEKFTFSIVDIDGVYNEVSATVITNP